MSAIVKISNLDKIFGRLHVLQNISLDITRSEVVCIIGRSGSGKSTLLRCINFLEEPSGGTIEVEGLVVKAGSKRQRTSQPGTCHPPQDRHGLSGVQSVSPHDRA